MFIRSERIPGDPPTVVQHQSVVITRRSEVLIGRLLYPERRLCRIGGESVPGQVPYTQLVLCERIACVGVPDKVEFVPVARRGIVDFESEGSLPRRRTLQGETPETVGRGGGAIRDNNQEESRHAEKTKTRLHGSG